MRCKSKHVAVQTAQSRTTSAVGTSLAQVISYDPTVVKDALQQLIYVDDLPIRFGEHQAF